MALVCCSIKHTINFLYVFHLLGCKINNLFFGEKESDKLRILFSTPKRRTILERNDCAIDISSSWYISCNGKKMPFQANTRTFRLRWDNRPNPPACFLKVITYIISIYYCIRGFPSLLSLLQLYCVAFVLSVFVRAFFRLKLKISVNIFTV